MLTAGPAMCRYEEQGNDARRKENEMQTAFTSAQLSTIRLALIGWTARCENEAKTMKDWAEDYSRNDPLHAKCLANAEASHRLKVEAEEVLAAMR